MESRPGSAHLLKFAEPLGLATAVPSNKDLDKLVRERGTILDVTAWRSRLGLIEPRVCRVEITPASGRTVMGTGFLLGPDLMLTATHVVDPVIRGDMKSTDVRLRFDYRRLSDGTTVNPGALYSLVEPDWLVSLSPAGPSSPLANAGVSDPTSLDYALVRVAGAPGNEPIGGDRAEPGAEPRGWIEIPKRPYDFLKGSSLFVLHHGMGGPLQASLGTDNVLGLDDTRTRVRYRAETAPGSGGAPCFDAGWELVALHEGRQKDIGQGIPISLIVEDLDRRGVGDVLRVRTV